MRYLARKYKLTGNTEDEQIRISLAEQQLKDNNTAFVRICYDTNFETLKIDYFKQLPQTLELLSKFLGDRPYFAGIIRIIFFSLIYLTYSLTVFVTVRTFFTFIY